MIICLFDIDGTLLSSGGAGKAAMEAALLEAFDVPAIHTQVSYSGRTDRAIGLDLLRHHGVEPTIDNLRKLLDGYLRMLPHSLRSHQGTVLPGIVTFLELLRERGETAVGLLTGNVKAGAAVKLGHFGIDHHFAFGGFGDHHLERDDVAREALVVAREYLNGHVAPDRVWVIGDTPLDVQCARAIGARVAAVATGWHAYAELEAAGPDLLLEDLTDPQPLLKAWEN